MDYHTTHPNWVPDATMGSRKDTAVLLVGTATEFGIPQRDIASTRGGFYISDRLAELVYDEAGEDDQAEPEPETVSGNETDTTKAAPKAAKTSGNRAGKNEQE